MTRTAIAATLLTLVASFCLNAESIVLKANVPFEFRIGEVRMPAGVYLVFEDRGLVKIRTERGTSSAIYLTTPAERKVRNASGILEFNRFGNENFLTRMWKPDSTLGVVLPKSKRESELMSRSASPQVATVALQRK